ncbi:protein of heat shock protein Hsp70 family [Rhodotorula toruloides]|uniref:BY PROTMAP: gi/472582840/gb/EMS20511.1/ protein of heat shock protein Hsp70 family [Rhodosporidium toruloides NP11] gi/647402101/emb/CDR48409.1/ RHTO0S17e02960g1_1 [Rhodosporidium toruloides] n=2 Tax=Rhodotorula toruloides TaxID=5286 RepID=A0A0K3CMZ2_RHOTO|nr:protein of heat shock protein Hsp70 family [Rhodotorula toruloides]
MKSYQEIVRTSSKRNPRNGRANPPTAVPSSPFISPTSHASTNGAFSPIPNGNGTVDREAAAAETKSVSGASEKRKGRFHGLARLQIGSLGRKDKGKGKASAQNGTLAVDEEEEGTYDGSEGGRYLVPPPVGPNGAMMLPPPPHHVYPYAYPPPGRPPYPYPQAYPAPPSTSVSSSAPVTTPATTTGASTSPTSPNTPTSAAHYYPYVATTSRLAPKRQNSNQMASPQSFRSRGSAADANGENGVDAEEKEEMLDVLPMQRRDVSGSSMGGRGSLPPGAGPPAPSAAYSQAPSIRSSPGRRGRGRSSSVMSAPSASRPPPPPVPPFPYPPYPPYPPPPGSAGYPYPPFPPYPYPPYPPYPPYGYPALPPPARTPGPPDPYGARPPFRPSASQASFGTASTSRRPPPPSSNGLPPPIPYGPHPFSAPVHPSSSASASAVARNMAKSVGPASQPREAGGSASKGKAKEEEGKMSVGIDFGTTFTGIAYGSSRLFSGQIRQILSWPGSYETYRKVPTCILYEQNSPDEEAKIVSWGLEAKNATVTKGLIKCEWFKLLLSPESLRSGVPDPWLPPLPVGKNVVDVIADFMRCIWRYARRMITEEIGSVVDLNAADVLLTVPAAWDAAACSLMRESALRAGLVQSSRGGDTAWRDRLQIITEPEAGAIHASTLATLHHLRPSQCFLLCDAGGGTVDTGVYKLMGQLSELEIAEMCVRSGANTGSLFVDLKFEELLRRILKDHPVHLEPASMATFIHAFAEGDKLAYHGTAEDDEAIFRFNCFNVEDSHDPAVGLEFGELAIPGKVLKKEVFDPIIEQVLELLSTQIAKIGSTPLDAIILVGGFAASEYLYTRVRQAFGAVVPVIVRPQDCDTATLRGAARYGLGLRQGKAGVSSVISPRSYCMKSRLPAEQEDHWRRPEFVTTNDGGTVVCENRLSYLIAKGAVLRKGERLRSRFCKFVKDPRDSVFTAHLFVSNSEELYRYTDEGDLTELCRWTVDLAALPKFHQIAEENGGGYIEFDLGLQLDSAEVRGVLMTEDGIECGAATFEFLGA